VEVLRVDSWKISLQDLADLEHYKNITQVHLIWVQGPSVTEALQMLKRCTNLSRLTLERWTQLFFPPSQELCGSIMEMKQLAYLHIIYRDNSYCDHFKSLVDKAKAFVLPSRPNFECYLSCCSKFDQFRISSCT
jgi:hypothetical protein